MPSTRLIDLLDLWGIDLREGSAIPVKVVRHAGDDDAPRRFYTLGLEQFEWYQSVQDRRIFGDAKLLVTFIKTTGLEAEFVGIYRVLGVEDRLQAPPFANGIPLDLLGKYNHPLRYRLARDSDFDQFRGCVRILWDRSENLWVRQHDYANREIAGIKVLGRDWVVPKDREDLSGLHFLENDDPFIPVSEFYAEGGRSLKTHFSIERSDALVRESKLRFKRQHGRIFCQVCSFDFLTVYGEEYIECHHTIPVHKLPSDGKTNIDDVVLICSNCHRMIHRRKEWTTIEQLKLLIAKRVGK